MCILELRKLKVEFPFTSKCHKNDDSPFRDTCSSNWIGSLHLTTFHIFWFLLFIKITQHLQRCKFTVVTCCYMCSHSKCLLSFLISDAVIWSSSWACCICGPWQSGKTSGRTHSALRLGWSLLEQLKQIQIANICITPASTHFSYDVILKFFWQDSF